MSLSWSGLGLETRCRGIALTVSTCRCRGCARTAADRAAQGRCEDASTSANSTDARPTVTLLTADQPHTAAVYQRDMYDVCSSVCL